MNKLRGFTLIELLIVVAIIAILAAIAVPNFLEAQVRSKVSRVRSDHRSLATAIETYYVDNNQYPAWTSQFAQSADQGYYQGTTPQNFGATFRIRSTATERLLTLTTPIAYVTSYFPDPFADVRGTTFRYFSDGRGWILGSFGPNVNQAAGGNLKWHNAASANFNINTRAANSIETIYDSRVSQPSELLIAGGEPNQPAFTYDPTNGTVSAGDVWRVKQ
ncbi:MAG: prepilin-type N-terminal cleavage/methylation domain-containing protein [Candidatus Sumerlaeia bacterium]|nr:prepilin-type N-terminal cleavage/methylation domain-containing protein [Candidatus Sumerlaeia bacterium]